MPLRITNIQLPVEQPEETLRDVIAESLGVPAEELSQCRILRKSLDARSRDSLKFVYTAVVQLAHEDVGCVQRSADAPLAAQARGGASALRWTHPTTTTRANGVLVERYEPPHFQEPLPGSEPLAERPIVVGSGPAGLLAAYYLARRGYRPIILERGEPVKERVPAIRLFDRGGPFDREDNYLFGEGGAGTFSDGKLTCRMSGPDVDWVLERFVECGGKESIRYENRPHLGSNRLPLLVRNIRRKIESLGGEYRFRCRLEELDIADGNIRGVQTSSGYLKTAVVILGIGHSARDTYEMLHRLGVPMQAKAFQLGLRIEQPQEQVNRHKYSRRQYQEILGAADYTLTARGQPDLYTFCMCAGGFIIPSVSEPEMFCTNGMSNSRHDTPFANSGLVVTIDPREFGSDHPLAGVELQRRYESLAWQLGNRDYLSPIQRATDFIARRDPSSGERLTCSYQRGTVAANLEEVIPPSVVRAIRAGLPIMDRKWHGDFLKNANLVGPEMRGSSPVRIARDNATRQTPGIAGLYPVGEGAGYAGGIISAAVDGLRSAKSVVSQFTTA